MFPLTSISVAVGWLLDFLIGDPPRMPHLVVAFGRWISFWEQRLNRSSLRRCKGALLAVVSVLLTFFAVWLALRCLNACPWMKCLVASVLVFYSLAGKTLRSEVHDVFGALERSLDDGRRQVARIVGRDTNSLSEQEVRTAALETLAENLSDGVVAPLFWCLLLGVPGMVAYKMVNTLDSMLGYRTPRYQEFGWWSARQDDFANYIPARFTALLILLAYKLLSLFRAFPAVSLKSLCSFVLRYGPCHSSPNSGWPEAALAACLDCRFGGTHDYFGQSVVKPYIGHNPRLLRPNDLWTSLRVCFFAELMAVAIVLLLSYLFSMLPLSVFGPVAS